MNSFHIRSVIFGIGIGIVITSIAGVIYATGFNPLDKLDEKDIDKLCSMYDLVRKSDVNEEKNNSIFTLEKDDNDETEKNSNNAGIGNEDMDNGLKNTEDTDNRDAEDADNNFISENKETKDSGEDTIAGENKEQNNVNVDESNTEKGDNNVGTGNERNDNESKTSENITNAAGATERNGNGNNTVNETKPAALEPGTEVVIKINRGDLSNAVGRKLYNKGLIDDIELFNVRIRDLGLTRSIIADTYRIKAGTSVDDIIKIITTKH